MSNQAIIVVDIQNDYFAGGKWVLAGVDAAADNAQAVINAARKNGDLVVHVQHVTLDANAPFFAPDTEGVQLHAKAKNLPHERVVVKHHMNPFRETGLQAILERNGIEKVVVVGNMSHMCIDAVTRHSADLGYETTVVHDACATHDLEFNGVRVPAAQVHAAFMAALKFGYAKVVSAAELVG
ncbi:Isochorismatase [Burkholderia sp. KK1]|uniref:Isochorismatase hydrolase n=1 Tax=Caballeronia cordobensis TaxID=1353886 RepID=A0A158F7H0_CABCO|nr:cysteine hydrolase family protein [Caballeronia cordobensis]AQG99940.1 Isochorismatase [Burkholderia sp. KK1]SAL15665.1 isochorismatase hydrolase [Caballeronia cordobensis]